MDIGFPLKPFDDILNVREEVQRKTSAVTSTT